MTIFAQNDNQAFCYASAPARSSAFSAVARQTVMVLPAFGISFCLFYLMAQLVISDAPFAPVSAAPIDVTPVAPRPDSVPDPIKRVIPPPPQPQEPPTQINRVPDAGPGFSLPVTAHGPVVTMTAPSLTAQATVDKTATPLVRIEPKYPPAAARDGINGWVQLRFNIQPDGRVSDIAVLAAEPRRVFDQEAIRALRNWKYQPKLENGRAVMQSDLVVQLDFQLDSQD